MDNVLLCDYTTFDKLETHKQCLKHFAFSVFLFNNKRELLLQRRAKTKYHSGGLWSNTCCSHFKNLDEFNYKENTIKERIQYELGISNIDDLQFIDTFSYNTILPNGLYENEVDDIFVCFSQDISFDINFNKNEIEDVSFISIDNLILDIYKNNDKYTEWLKLIIQNKNILSKIKKYLHIILNDAH